jgi:hypothetical protein
MKKISGIFRFTEFIYSTMVLNEATRLTFWWLEQHFLRLFLGKNPYGKCIPV